MNCIEEITKDANVIEIDDQLLVLINRQVETELMLEEKFRDLCEEVSNFVKEIEDVVKKVERLSCKDVAKETARFNNAKVIKEEFEKLESLKISDDPFTCNTSLESFHKEFSQMSRMDDDLFTYEVEIPGLASISCDLNKEDDSEQQMTHGSDADMEYDPSNVEFTE
ncbi:hypothetical protein Tco_0460858 [Tanacetum coccineum]